LGGKKWKKYSEKIETNMGNGIAIWKLRGQEFGVSGDFVGFGGSFGVRSVGRR